MIVVALLGGVVMGIGVTLWWARSRRATVPVAPSPVPQAAIAGGPDHRDVWPLLEAAIEQLDRAVIVFGSGRTVIFRNATANAMRGTTVGVLLDSAVDEVVTESRRVGRVERQLDLHGPPRSSLLVSAEPVGGGDAVVVVTDDISDRVRIDKMRTDFVANISHELKTPVGAIAVLADALLGEDDPAVVDRVANRIVDESERAVTTIDDLLELSRIESAYVPADVMDVHDVVQAALARGRTLEESSHVRLSAFDARESIWIRGDYRQLVSAVGNLVENAVKYSEPEGLVQVRTRQDERWIEIMVADQGVGIPARDLDRVFERFYRVDRARARSTGGTGLGLSIVRHVASNHGGDVQVSSTEGEGSTFVLRLPTSILATAPDEDARSDQPALLVDGDGAGTEGSSDARASEEVVASDEATRDGADGAQMSEGT